MQREGDRSDYGYEDLEERRDRGQGRDSTHTDREQSIADDQPSVPHGLLGMRGGATRTRCWVRASKEVGLQGPGGGLGLVKRWGYKDPVLG